MTVEITTVLLCIATILITAAVLLFVPEIVNAWRKNRHEALRPDPLAEPEGGGMVKKTRGNRKNVAYMEIFIGRDDQYYWRMRGGNWEKICRPEGYTTKQSCMRTAKSIFRDLSYSPHREWIFRDLTH